VICNEWGERVSYKPALRTLATAAGLVAYIFSIMPTEAGSIFVSGEDPDFHDQAGPNTLGAIHIIDQGLTYARNGNTAPILFVYTDPAPNIALGITLTPKLA
jgi:hypothetical protein